MKLVILSDESLKKELLSNGADTIAELVWVNHIAECNKHIGANAFIDLLFENGESHSALLENLLPSTIIVNSVSSGLEAANRSFIRINGWPSFLRRPITEAIASDVTMRADAEKIIGVFNKQIQWTSGREGFVSARIVANIINEAYFALEEHVSTREEIDMAMKLGTNYPYGPFEWAAIIGVKKIYRLLKTLSETDSIYQPASLLAREAND